MPITFTLDPERRRVLTRASGTVTFAELQEFARARVAAGAATYEQVFDARGAQILLNTAELERLIEASQAAHGTLPFAPTAIVADQDVTYGIARIAEVLASFAGISSRVFRSMEEAEEWLKATRRGAAEVEE